MAINNLDKCKSISAPAVQIRGLFNSYFQTETLTDGAMGTNGYLNTTCLSFQNVQEYNAGKVYVLDAENGQNPPASIVLSGTTNNDYRYAPESIRSTSLNALPNNLTATTGFNNLRGYLIPHKVADFVGDGVHISRVYNNQATQTNYNTGRVSPTQGYCVLVDTDTRAPLNDLPTYSEWFIPQIRWVYEDDSGNTQIVDKALMFYYFFSSTSVRNKVGKRLSVMGTDNIVYNYSVHAAQAPYHFAFSPPYVSAETNRYTNAVATGGICSGAVYVKWSSPSTYHTHSKEISAPYVLLCNANPAGITAAQTFEIEDKVGISATKSLPTTGLPNRTPQTVFPAYKSVEEIVAHFADYGIKLYTDLDECVQAPPSEDGKINPDNPAEQIPYFPDNSTETTPIEQAYITPSTFAQSCVYNPLSTRDFLRWVCDNTVDIGNWKRLFANPVDVITGINLYNLDIPAHDNTHVAFNSATNILGVTSNIPNYSILDGYNNIISGGELTLQAYYGNYADFTSMTYQMFIPFVGFTALRACDVVNHTLRLYYAVDFATGSAVAFVNSDDRLIYSSPCTVAGKIPLSTSDKNSQMINNTLSILGSVGGLMGGIASGNVGGGVGALLNGLGGLQMQTNYSNKGSLSAVNIYKLLPAFIERTRYDLFFPSDDQQYLGAKYQGAAGAPSTYFDTLINCANVGGFVQSDVVYLTSDTATEAEKAEIISLIKSGIYL